MYAGPFFHCWCDDVRPEKGLTMTFLQHPAFQSLVLPVLLALSAIALLRLAGERWSSLGAGLGLLLALAVWPGFEWPASSRAQTVPWVVLAGLIVAAIAMGLHAPGTKPLGRGRGLLTMALFTALAIALAVWAALGGSLLLAQLALMVGSVAGVACLWAWRSASVVPAALLPLVLAGLTIAFAQGAQAPASPEGETDQDDPYYTPKWK